MDEHPHPRRCAEGFVEVIYCLLGFVVERGLVEELAYRAVLGRELLRGGAHVAGNGFYILVYVVGGEELAECALAGVEAVQEFFGAGRGVFDIGIEFGRLVGEELGEDALTFEAVFNRGAYILQVAGNVADIVVELVIFN